MKQLNTMIEYFEERKDDGITTLELRDQINDEFANYKEFENGKFHDDCLASKIMVQLNDANGKIFVGNVQMVVGYCGENVILTGDLTEII